MIALEFTELPIGLLTTGFGFTVRKPWPTSKSAAVSSGTTTELVGRLESDETRKI
jgi:hypothetical protein